MSSGGCNRIARSVAAVAMATIFVALLAAATVVAEKSDAGVSAFTAKKPNEQ